MILSISDRGQADTATVVEPENLLPAGCGGRAGAAGAGPALSVEVQARVVDPESALAGNAPCQGSYGAFVKVLHGPAAAADQVVVVARLAPDIGGDVAWPLQALREPGFDEHVQGSKDGSPADIRMPAAEAIIKFLDAGLLLRPCQDMSDRQALGGEPLAGSPQRARNHCLSHIQMIQAGNPATLTY